ncbi:MAG: GNAT family N-acetyltransferase [Isosphaeraceae bacterium]
MSLPETSRVALGIERFNTPRMVAERLRLNHYPEVRQLHLHPQVLKTLSPDGQILPDHVTKDGLVQSVAHWAQHGFGLWLFRSRKDGRFVGRGGLQYYTVDGQDVVGLVYSVVFDCWNKGLATEIAVASLDIGFKRFEFPEITCWTLPSNIASQRVMEKVGFRYDTEIAFGGLPHRLYRLSALGWELGRGR